ncbi:MAG: prepilin peptidase [Desulfobacterales bacterium]|jgi:leader peptidase (prepilin peptidase)/N-methyltransferase|nr:prepilin peptidase [Desulfobacterales bacterium]
MMNVLAVGLIFMFGLCIGSFLNVCIYRLPSSMSIIRPSRSMCPKCGSAISFYDNIPVFSYLWLKGRCRHCQAPISLRYPIVEMITGIISVDIYFMFGPTLSGAVYFIFISSLLVITFIDIDHKIIPDVITLPGIPAGLAASFVLPAISFKTALLGLLAGGGSLLIVAWTYSLITRKEGMGGGDIKLLAMIGAFVGWKGVVFTIFSASVAGTFVGLIVMLVKGKDLKYAIPFGPFLSIGAMSYIFFGEKVMLWYFHSF